MYYNKDEKTNYILSVDYLDYLRLEIYDEPYAILDTGVGSPQPYNDITMTLLADDMPGSIYMGYIAYINGKTIVIPEDGHYELKGEGLEIQSLSFAKDTNLEVRYNVVINQIEDVSKILSVTNFMTKIGQEQKGFTPMASFYNDLYKKYYTDHPGNYAQSIASLNGIRVNANPGTIVYVKEDGEMYAQRHIIGQTESLDFYSDDVVISDVYFSGMHFEQATDYELMRDTLPEGKCHITEIVVDNLDKIEKGSLNFEKTIKTFYDEFEKSLKTAEASMEGKRVKVPEVESDVVCELCGRKMVIKSGRFGKFLACPGFPECKNAKPLPEDEVKEPCPKCGGKLVKRKSKKGKTFYACSNYPECDFAAPGVPTGEVCETCGSFMLKGTRGRTYCINSECPTRVEGREKAATKKKSTTKKTIKKSTAKKTTAKGKKDE